MDFYNRLIIKFLHQFWEDFFRIRVFLVFGSDAK